MHGRGNAESNRNGQGTGCTLRTTQSASGGRSGRSESGFPRHLLRFDSLDIHRFSVRFRKSDSLIVALMDAPIRPFLDSTADALATKWDTGRKKSRIRYRGCFE